MLKSWKRLDLLSKLIVLALLVVVLGAIAIWGFAVRNSIAHDKLLMQAIERPVEMTIRYLRPAEGGMVEFSTEERPDILFTASPVPFRFLNWTKVGDRVEIGAVVPESNGKLQVCQLLLNNVFRNITSPFPPGPGE